MSDNTLHYTDCGLDYVYLANGFTWHETEYGPGVSIDDMDGLHQAIARHVVLSETRLRGQEVRFLRAMLDLSQEDLARPLGATRVTVARWEGEPDTPIPKPSDRLLRLVYARRHDPEIVGDIADLLEGMEEARAKDERFRETKEGWRPERRAA